MHSFPFNRDWKRRNAILQPFVRTDGPFADFDQSADIYYFRDLTVAVVGQLLEERFLDPDERQNESPRASEYYAFMRRHPGVLAHGYAIGIGRDDYRVSIEGIGYRGAVSDAMRQDAQQLFGNADNFQVEGDGLYVWFD